MLKKVVITIKGGRINGDFQGFHGKTCETLEQRLRPEGLELQEVEGNLNTTFKAKTPRQSTSLPNCLINPAT